MRWGAPPGRGHRMGGGTAMGKPGRGPVGSEVGSLRLPGTLAVPVFPPLRCQVGREAPRPCSRVPQGPPRARGWRGAREVALSHHGRPQGSGRTARMHSSSPASQSVAPPALLLSPLAVGGSGLFRPEFPQLQGIWGHAQAKPTCSPVAEAR